ncbi:MAG: four helix bundle protein [Flavisolibacter sp.]|nr:four helix bundle protein [Flavisolibacter sp.]
MKENNIILEKPFLFGLRIIKLHFYLKEKKVDRVLSLQLLRSGTSIGANVEEAMGGSSKKDFMQKLRIAYREARETRYWLRLLKHAELLEAILADSITSDCEEILRILTSILNSLKTKNY